MMRALGGGRSRPADANLGSLCLETQSREVMAKLVHDVVAEAMRLGLHGGAPPERVENANGARFGRSLTKVRNG